MRFLRWWLAEHTDVGHTAPTALMLFADQGDPDHPESWPPADADSRVYRLPCHQTGCAELHDVRPVALEVVLAAIGARPLLPYDPDSAPSADYPAGRGVWIPVSLEMAGFPAEWSCDCGSVQIGRWHNGETMVCAICHRVAKILPGEPTPRIRVDEFKQLTVWMPLSGVAAGLPAGWTCPGCGMADVGRHYPHTLVVCAHCTRVVRDLRGPAEEVQVGESSRGGRMSGGVS